MLFDMILEYLEIMKSHMPQKTIKLNLYHFDIMNDEVLKKINNKFNETYLFV